MDVFIDIGNTDNFARSDDLADLQMCGDQRCIEHLEDGAAVVDGQDNTARCTVDSDNLSLYLIPAADHGQSRLDIAFVVAGHDAGDIVTCFARCSVGIRQVDGRISRSVIVGGQGAFNSSESFQLPHHIPCSGTDVLDRIGAVVFTPAGADGIAGIRVRRQHQLHISDCPGVRNLRVVE